MLNKIIARFTRMAKMDNTVYTEIKQDAAATQEAAIIVVAAAFLSAIGSLGGNLHFGGFVLNLLVNTLVTWLLFSYVTMFVGTRFFGGQATFTEMMRTLGYASAPMALGLLNLIPCLGWLISIAAFVLYMIVAFMAIRETQGLTTDKTLITVFISAVIVMIIYAILVVFTIL